MKSPTTVRFTRVAVVLILTSIIIVSPSDSTQVDEAQTEKAWMLHTIDDSSRGADGVRLADANGDGLLDIATGWEQGGVVRVYLNPGRAKVRDRWPAVTVGRVGDPEDAVLVDLDRDGAVDVVSSCEGKTQSLFVHWAPKDSGKYLDPEAWRTEAISATRGRRWMFSLPMQVDNKRGIDIVVGGKDAGAQIGWLESHANPRNLAAWKWHGLYDAGWIMSLVAIDMDGDGDQDVLASDRKGPNRGCLWLERPAEPAAAWPLHRIGTVGDREVMFLDLADLDGDGLLDVLAPTYLKEILWFRRKTARPISWDTVTLQAPFEQGSGKAVRIGDVDLNGTPDIVLSSERGGGVWWLSNIGTKANPKWKPRKISGDQGTKFDLTELVDLDGDGDLDVITTEEVDGLGVIWYENPLLRK